MISEPEARASLFHSLTAQSFDRAQFDLYLDAYLRQRASEARSVEATTWRPRPEAELDAIRVDQMSVAAVLQDAAVNPELASFAALMAADYDRAKEIVSAMAAPDRAVLEFWATELSQLVSHVQITEERF